MRGRTAAAVSIAAAGLALTITGLAAMGSDRCFFRQFPPAYCTPASSGLPGLGLAFFFGIALLGVAIALGATR